MSRRAVVACSCDARVFGHGGRAPPPELDRQDLLENLELDLDHAKDRGQRYGVLDEIAPDGGRQGFDGKRAELHAIGDDTRLDRVAVEEHRGARAHQPQVSIHGVLIQRDEHIDLVTLTENGLVTRAEGQEDVTAANDGLVRIVGIHVEPAADEDPRQNVAGSGNSLARRATNTNGKVDSAHSSSPVGAHKYSSGGPRRAPHTAEPGYRELSRRRNATTRAEGERRR